MKKEEQGEKTTSGGIEMWILVKNYDYIRKILFFFLILGFWMGFFLDPEFLLLIYSVSD